MRQWNRAFGKPDIAIHSAEAEFALTDMGRRGAESTGSELLEKKAELEKNHTHVKKELNSIQMQVQTLERLASDRRNEEATLTSRYNELREQIAVLREQKTHQLTSIQEMEMHLNRLNRNCLYCKMKCSISPEATDGGELTAEQIALEIE